MVGSAFELIIFDCDGVLIDSEVIANRVHAEALTALGYTMTTRDMIDRFAGMSDAAMYALIERELGRPIPAGHPDEVKSAILAAFTRELRPIAGVAEVLAAIGTPRCVASSSAPERLRHSLQCAGLYDHFAPHVFSASMVARGKPAPDLFLFAAAQLGVAHDAAIVIEDSVMGVRAARAAHMPVLGFHGGSHCAPGHGERLATEGADRVFPVSTYETDMRY